MLQIALGRVKSFFYPANPEYEGKVVEWRPQQAVFHHRPPRAASVRATANWIIARAEKVKAYKELQRRRSTLRCYVVSLYGDAYFYSKDELEWRVRDKMLRRYTNCEVVLGIGSPRKIWAVARGILVGVNGDHVVLKLKYIRHINRRAILQPKKPVEHLLKAKKIQQVMLYCEYR